jgi:hypothetical protein
MAMIYFTISAFLLLHKAWFLLYSKSSRLTGTQEKTDDYTDRYER